MSNDKKIKAKMWFLDWYKYFEAYLEMARIGLLQLDEQKYLPENLFKKGSLYDDQLLLIPVIWCLKHSIELLLKYLDIRITEEFSPVHNNTKLYDEIKKAFLKLKITDDKSLNALILLSDKYFSLNFWRSTIIWSDSVRDSMNDIFRYPESTVNFSLNIGNMNIITKEAHLEIGEDIKKLNKIALKLHGQISRAKVRQTVIN